MLHGIVSEQTNGAGAVPGLERCGFVLGFPVWLLDLEHGIVAGHLHDDRRGPRLEFLAQGPAPALRDYAGVGQRYASACRFLSDGSFSRIRRSRARSSSAEMTVSSSGACASTIPHGSTINERP